MYWLVLTFLGLKIQEQSYGTDVYLLLSAKNGSVDVASKNLHVIHPSCLLSSSFLVPLKIPCGSCFSNAISPFKCDISEILRFHSLHYVPECSLHPKLLQKPIYSFSLSPHLHSDNLSIQMPSDLFPDISLQYNPKTHIVSLNT